MTGHEEFAEQLRQAQAEAATAQQRVTALKKQCPHTFDDDRESAHCGICGDSFGWKCTSSPDRVCHYLTRDDNGKVQLLDGSQVDPPQGHVVENETEDSCIYCGHPEERL